MDELGNPSAGGGRARGGAVVRGVAVVVLVALTAACGQRGSSAVPTTTGPTPRDAATTATTGGTDPGANLSAGSGGPAALPLDAGASEPGQARSVVVTGSAPTEPGVYTYGVTGLVDGDPVLGRSVLTVSEPAPDGRQTVTESTPGGATTTVYRIAGEGRYLESVTLLAGSRDLVLVPDEPLLLVPDGAAAGTSTAGRLSGDRASAQVRYRLVGLDRTRIVHETTTTLTAEIGGGCTLRGTVVVTAAVRASDQLPLEVQTEASMEVTGAPACAATTTSKLRSVLQA